MYAEFVAEPLLKDTALTKLEVSLAPTTIRPVPPLKEILPLIVPPANGRYPERSVEVGSFVNVELDAPK